MAVNGVNGSMARDVLRKLRVAPEAAGFGDPADSAHQHTAPWPG
jgi:hypothetical protein